MPGPDDKEWSEAERKTLLEYYVDGMSGVLIAKLFDSSVIAVAEELARLVLGVDELKSNPQAPSYGRTWDWHDEQLLKREYQLRRPLSRIARALGRDELGVAFKILDMRPPLPMKIIEKYDLQAISNTLGPLEGDKAQFVRVCSQCDDVTLYCKCLISNVPRSDVF